MYRDGPYPTRSSHDYRLSSNDRSRKRRRPQGNWPDPIPSVNVPGLTARAERLRFSGENSTVGPLIAPIAGDSRWCVLERDVGGGRKDGSVYSAVVQVSSGRSEEIGSGFSCSKVVPSSNQRCM